MTIGHGDVDFKKIIFDSPKIGLTLSLSLSLSLTLSLSLYSTHPRSDLLLAKAIALFSSDFTVFGSWANRYADLEHKKAAKKLTFAAIRVAMGGVG